MKNSTLRCIYMANDLVLSFAAIILFDIIKYNSLPEGFESRPLDQWLFHDTNILWGLIIFPLMMMTFYGISGYYNEIMFKSRLNDVKNSFVIGLFGTLIIYFITLINDGFATRHIHYELILILWGLLSIPVMTGRIVITNIQRDRLKKLGGCYTAVIIGNHSSAETLRKRLMPRRKRSISNYRIIGEISPEKPFDDIIKEVEDLAPDALLVTSQPGGIQSTLEIISKLFPIGPSILITPDLFYLLTSRNRTDNVVGDPLIDISSPPVSASTANIKRIIDVVGSALALILLSPLFAAIAVAVRLDSKGEVFYRQERVGFHKKPFKIIKFRTMHPDAESTGPALSNADDPRITRVGHILRKYRLDELPQFWNVIKGDMSLVGPRPERQHYIEQIVKRVPHYSLIHQVRPGITSWGMVKYGYATNVDEMVERLYYDLLYIENVSISVDIKILFHTFSTVVSGRGL